MKSFYHNNVELLPSFYVSVPSLPPLFLRPVVKFLWCVILMYALIETVAPRIRSASMAPTYQIPAPARNLLASYYYVGLTG